MNRLTLILSALFLLIFTACQPSYSDGEFLYKTHCSSCHMDDGSGLNGLIPPIAKSDFLIKNRSQLSCIILHGLNGPIEVNGIVYSDQKMIGIPTLKPAEITNILNYIHNNLGNKNPIISLPEVKAQIESCSQ